jgi:predicted ester cyclase
MLIGAFRAGFPDMHVTFQDQIAEGNQVTNRLTMRGTHQGNFQGIPPTGKAVTITGINVMRVEQDKIAEIWGALDVMGLMQQIGAVPSPEPAGL